MVSDLRSTLHDRPINFFSAAPIPPPYATPVKASPAAAPLLTTAVAAPVPVGTAATPAATTATPAAASVFAPTAPATASGSGGGPAPGPAPHAPPAPLFGTGTSWILVVLLLFFLTSSPQVCLTYSRPTTSTRSPRRTPRAHFTRLRVDALWG